jgi:hypothetical protein
MTRITRKLLTSAQLGPLQNLWSRAVILFPDREEASALCVEKDLVVFSF